MRVYLLCGLTLALAACHPVTPVVPPSAGLDRQLLHVGGEDTAPQVRNAVWTLPFTGPQGERLRPVRATASTQYRSLKASRVIDGNTATAWAAADVREGKAWLMLEFSANTHFKGMRIKTDPTAHGVTFKAMTSTDGVSWEPSSGRMVNLSWGMERQEVAGQGRFLKLELFNHMEKPTSRFQIFELEAYGGALAPGVRFPWIGQ